MEVFWYWFEIELVLIFQVYEVFFICEWVVLDGLIYIKDYFDGIFFFCWLCWMGICGSSGMMINGDLKLVCVIFFVDYLFGLVWVELM